MTSLADTPEPFFAEHDVTLWQGHVLDVLPTLPAESVNCVVTSPPYYGLRDYGTGAWEGAEDGCDHKGAPKASTTSGLKNDGRPNPGRKEYELSATTPYRDVCGKCGARRVDHQIGLEASPGEYVAALRAVFGEVRRVLREDGVLWLNIGDSYSSGSGGDSNLTALGERLGTGGGQKADSSKVRRPQLASPPPKNLLGVPWRVAFALQDDGWILRNSVVWHKPNAMPESVTDRLSTRYEHVFLFTRSRRYWFDLDPIREPHSTNFAVVDKSNRSRNRFEATSSGNGVDAYGSIGYGAAGRNPGDVWTIATQPYAAAHFATFPPELARRCILAGCPQDGTVLDPFTGSGTTLMVARQLMRKSVGVELNPDYCALAVGRIGQPVFDFGEVV